MKIVSSNNRGTRVVYAEQVGAEYLLSPFDKVVAGRRPITRYDSREELEAYAASRNCEVRWLGG